jgi:hypothetical protein
MQDLPARMRKVHPNGAEDLSLPVQPGLALRLEGPAVRPFFTKPEANGVRYLKLPINRF